MDQTPTIKFLRLNPQQDRDIDLPRYMTPHAAGMDVAAALKTPLEIQPGQIELIPTGLAMSIQPGFEVQIRPRSGLAFRHGLTLVNPPGTIDADYRGEIKVAMIHLGKVPYTLKRGDRIAQMVLQRVYQARIQEVSDLDQTQREDGGFGHTGR